MNKKLTLLLLPFFLLFLGTNTIPGPIIIPQMLIFGPPISSIPANGCPTGAHSTNSWFCDVQKSSLPNATGISVQIKGTDIDQGVTAPSFVWTSVDSQFQLYTGIGVGVASLSNTGGVTTATMAGSSPGKWEIGDWICIQNSPTLAYNSCWLITGATYVANLLTSVTWSQTSPVSTDSSGSATMANSCGANLAQGPKLCQIVPIIRHTQNNPSPVTPAYVYDDQTWVQSIIPAWSAVATLTFHEQIKVGTHYYIETAVGSNGLCTTGGTIPNNFSTSGGTNSDGTCTWLDKGTSPFPQEALCGTGFVGDATAPPIGTWVANGVIFNKNSNICNGGAGACTTTDVATCFVMSNETPFKVWYTLINAAIIQHYAGVSWALQIPYVRIGGWIGGEWFGWFKATICNAAWWNLTYAQYQGLFVDGFAADSFRKNAAAYKLISPTPHMNIETALNSYAGCVSDVHCQDFFNELAIQAKAASPTYALGNQGWEAADGPSAVANPNASQSGNWPQIFKSYCRPGMVTFPCQLQSFAESCPDNATSGQCPANAITNGSMRILLPYATQNYASSLEIYNTDWLCAFDSFYTTGNGNTTHATFADCQLDAYQSLFANAAAGTPNLTMRLQGNIITQ